MQVLVTQSYDRRYLRSCFKSKF